MDTDLAKKALDALISTIEQTGGIVELESGDIVPVADEEWIDLADAYIAAKQSLSQDWTLHFKFYDEGE